MTKFKLFPITWRIMMKFKLGVTPIIWKIMKFKLIRQLKNHDEVWINYNQLNNHNEV